MSGTMANPKAIAEAAVDLDLNVDLGLEAAMDLDQNLQAAVDLT